MSYTITNTSGATVATVADGTINSTSTSLTLIGKNYAGYGVFLNDNYVKLLENFSNGSSPSSPVPGQIWFDSTNRILKLYDTSAQWKSLCASTTALSQPTNPITGDLWWDMSNNQLKAYGGSSWVLIGPTYTTSSGQSGAIVETIVDTNSVSHVAIKFYVQNSVMAIVSKDSSYTPQTAISGYTTINPGINLISSSTIAGSSFNGSVTNALAVGGLSSTQLLRNDITGQQINGSLSVVNNNGITIGASNNFTVGVNSVNQAVNLSNSQLSADINFYITSTSQGLIRLLTLSGSTGQVLLPNSIVSTSSTTGALVVTGGVGVGGSLNTGDSIKVGSLTNSTSSTTGALVVNGGVGIGSSLNVGTTANIGTDLKVSGYANLVSGYSSTTTSTGALIVTGGVGVSGNINAGGSISAGNINANYISGTILGNVVSVITTVGTLGNLNVTGGANIGGILTDTANISSTSTSTGSIVITGIGGLGVGGNVYVGGNINSANITSNVISTISAVIGNITASVNNVSNIGSTTSGFNYLYVGNIMPTSNQIGNIGSSTAYYNRVYATSTSALYSDLAERFHADAVYSPGTVVELGGINEITISTGELSEKVFGIISTAPAYLMNDNDGTDEYHPPVALQGRVPVRVVGQVNKGDRLVSAGNGVARSANRSEITPFNVIGRSLVNKTSDSEELILAIVKAIS